VGSLKLDEVNPEGGSERCDITVVTTYLASTGPACRVAPNKD
jgi:hypothetical protein